MFWERFYNLCKMKGMSPTPFVKSIGISHGIVTKWKNGTVPNCETLIKIADELDCSVDYLLGRDKYVTQPQAQVSEIKEVPQQEDEGFKLYSALDALDKAEARGVMKHMLTAEKYRQDDTSAAAKMA